MTGIVDKVKSVLHSDKHDSTTTTTKTTHTTTGTGGYTGSGTGVHGASGSTTGHSSTNYENPQSSNSGPHASNMANTVDPRIDSDNSKSGYGHQGTSGTTQHYGNSGTTGVGSNTHGSTNAGPHQSNMANKVDPRVDSDRDGSRNVGAGPGAGSSGFGSSNTHGTTGHSTAGHSTTGTTTSGPHSNNMANKLDPRVDSDRDGSRNAGAATTGGYSSGTTGYSGTHTGNSNSGYTGTSGGISSSTNAGPHNSNMANKADPRIDSDLDSKGNRHGASTTGGVLGASGSHATPGSGTAQNTAGPHNSDMLNKLDPRVDADLDGSKTYGGNATHR